MTVGRAEDKSANVRRAALQLLTALLQHNLLRPLCLPFFF